MHVVETKGVWLVFFASRRHECSVIEARVLGEEGVVLVFGMAARHGPRVHTIDGKFKTCFVGKVFFVSKVGIKVAIPEVLITTGAACPLPLSFCGESDVETGFLAEFVAVFHGTLPADADGGLMVMVGCVALHDMVFPHLIEEFAVVVGEDGTQLRIVKLKLGHPKSFFDLHDGGCLHVDFSAAAAHDEAASRDAYKVDVEAFGDIDALADYSFFGLERLCLLGAQRPVGEARLTGFTLRDSELLRAGG